MGSSASATASAALWSRSAGTFARTSRVIGIGSRSRRAAPIALGVSIGAVRFARASAVAVARLWKKGKNRNSSVNENVNAGGLTMPACTTMAG